MGIIFSVCKKASNSIFISAAQVGHMEWVMTPPGGNEIIQDPLDLILLHQAHCMVIGFSWLYES